MSAPVDYGLLLVERDDAVATIRLNRPDKRNALSDALRRQLAQAADDLAKDDDVRVAVLTGNGPAFCAGFDRSEFEDGSETFNDPDTWSSGQLMHEALGRFPKPLIAAVNGPAMGGGFDIATQCDVRIAGRDAIFGHPEIKFGAPTLVSILADIIGPAHARDLCLSGRGIDAEEAHRIGLVAKVTEPDALMDETYQYARMTADAPLDALKVVKAAIVDRYPFRAP